MLRLACYDAENRMISTTTLDGTTTTYQYGGDGRRVQKVGPAGTTLYVYDWLGNLAQEYGPSTDSGTKYVTTDPLGSTRLIAKSDGTVDKSYDYLPFGQEILSGTDGRDSTFPTLLYPHVPGGQSLEFTGKERDAESGLDYFEARYFSSAQGRFTSPDEFKGGIVDPFTGRDIETNTALPYADITDPQTLNKYGYVRNNPLRYVDPNGHEILGSDPDGGVSLPNFEAVTNAFISGYKNVEGFAERHPLLVAGAQVILAIVTRGESSEGGGATAGETPSQGLGDLHAPGDAPNATVIVRGGQSEMPAPGTTFSGSQGATTAEAAAGVPHGQIRESTARDIRAGGGKVEVKPERARSGTLNPKHVDVREGKSTFGPLKPNPVPKKDRIE
jgi:RHS repeat-associated protein